MIQPATLKFLRSLGRNNDKAWFDAHRSQYQTAKSDMEAFLDQIIGKLGVKDADIAGLTPKQCMFRINRDVRFSKNKAPYKTNFGASLAKGGKKSIYAGYYLHLEPGASFAGGGLWMPIPQELAKLRQEIDYCYDEFKGILKNKTFKKQYGTLYMADDIRLTRVPKGYDSDNPAGEFLKLKSFIAMRPIKDPVLTSPTALKEVTEAFFALTPLLQFINRSLSDQ